MAKDEDWGEKNHLPNGTWLRFYFITNRWYLYDRNGVVITSNKTKSVVLNRKEAKE